MIDYATAIARLLANAEPTGIEQAAVEGATGRVVAQPVVAPESLPPFDNSAMDGFALASRGQIVPIGTTFDVAGESAAGDGPLVAGSDACEIMTGARMPDGLDAVVPVEQVETLASDAEGRPARIRLQTDVRPGQHLRRAGEDVAAGGPLLAAGRVIGAAERMLCAALGIATIAVHGRPRVALVNTGRELVDDPAQALTAGQIRNSNGPFLAARLEAAGAQVVLRATIGDDADALQVELDRARAAGADIVITTGAVSMGRYDFIPGMLDRLGAETLFHKVSIRPGKPVLAARLPSGVLLVGLPGNPASTAVGLRFFVEPLLRAMLGLPPEPMLRLPLAAPYAKRVPLRMHLKARVELASDCRLQVRILGGQESFRIRPLVDANAWAVVPADVDALDADSMVLVCGRGHLEPLALES